MSLVSKLLLVASIPIVLIVLLAQSVLSNDHGVEGNCQVPGDYGTIQLALDDPTCSTVFLESGSYHENLEINRSVSILGQSVGNTVLDGLDSGRVMTITSGVAVTLTELTLTNGSASEGGAIFVNAGSRLQGNQLLLLDNRASRGGAIYNYEGFVILNNTVLSDSYASSLGGAIFNQGDLVLSGSELTLNSTNYQAGGIWNDGRLTMEASTLDRNRARYGGGILSVGETEILSSTLVANRASSSGGAIHISGGYTTTIGGSLLLSNTSGIEGGAVSNYGVITLTDTTFRANSALNGGALINRGPALVTNSVFESNWVTTDDDEMSAVGGGISNSGVMTLSRSTIIGNWARDRAGGIIHHGQNLLSIDKSTLVENWSETDGGAIYNRGNLTVASSTVSANWASRYGGGMYQDVTQAATVRSTTFSENAAGEGGGALYNVGLVWISNSILANSSTGLNCVNDLNSQGYNLDSDFSCSLAMYGDVSGVDPLLGPLQDNGGETLTHALSEASPALDAGSCPQVETDQREMPRPADVFGTTNFADGCDIGAYEFQPDGDVTYVYLPLVNAYHIGAVVSRVSVSSDELQANNYSRRPSISANGRFVAFYSAADNLVSGDTNERTDVFVRDRWAGTTSRVSVASDGAQANESSYDARISADGRYVVFVSKADNLVASDTNGGEDVFVHYLQTRQTTIISVSSSGVQFNNGSTEPAISADGSIIAFVSAFDLSGSSNGIFVHDRQSGETTLASVNDIGDPLLAGSPRLSGDGRYVVFKAFTHYYTDLGECHDHGSCEVILVRDRQLGETTKIAHASCYSCFYEDLLYLATISAEGRHIVFSTGAEHIVPGDMNGLVDVFVHDQLLNETSRLSISYAGEEANDDVWATSVSASGRYVLFNSEADNLVAGDTNEVSDHFIYDGQTGDIWRVNVAVDGGQAGYAHDGVISGDARFFVFVHDDDIVPDPTNGYPDVFVRDLAEWTFDWPGNGE